MITISCFRRFFHNSFRRGSDSARLRPALVHHCDRGVQYAAGEYTALLAEHGIAISMRRKASPNDNAKAEPFTKTLKFPRFPQRASSEKAFLGR